jgi:hypothetical protein
MLVKAEKSGRVWRVHEDGRSNVSGQIAAPEKSNLLALFYKGGVL